MDTSTENNQPTRSANESSSCPIRDDFLLHLAILPSMKSKNNPKGINPRAAQMLLYSVGSPKQYRIEERTDMTARGAVSDEIVSNGEKLDFGLASTEAYSNPSVNLSQK